MRPRPLAAAPLAAAAIAFAALAVGALLSACDEEVSGGSGAAPEDGATSKSIQVLCRAAEAADRGRVDDARALFADLHADLHTLADDAAAGDGGGGGGGGRAAAARLLEAKQRVEADLGRPAASDARSDPELAGDLRSLAAAVADAGAASGGTARTTATVPEGCA